MTITIRKLHLAIAVLAVALITPATAFATHIFSDVPDVPDVAFYADPVEWAFNNEITTGKSPTQFAPLDGVTRGESVTFLNRYDTNVVQPAFTAMGADLAAVEGRVPAGVNFAQDDLDFAAHQLNGRPRQTLGWKTSSEKLAETLQ